MECPILSQTLYELLGINAANPPDFVSLMITFVKKNPDPSNDSEADGASVEKILENVPEVRIYFGTEIEKGQEDNKTSLQKKVAEPLPKKTKGSKGKQ